MDDLVFMLKTYKEDYAYYKRLIDTFLKYNVDHIRLYVVVPEKDMQLFQVAEEEIIVIKEESLPVAYFKKKYNGFAQGYLNQQIVKLSFWELGLCENYFCIDVDCYFIKNFYRKDFIYRGDTPYTIFYDDRELLAKPFYYKVTGKNREKYNRIIANELQVDKEGLKSCHGFAILSSRVLENFKTEFLDKKGWDYRNIIAKAPLEFTWYNYWLLKNRKINVYGIAPLMKCYHTKEQLLSDIRDNVSVNDIKRYYIGIVVNSRFGKDLKLYRYEDAGSNKVLLVNSLMADIKNILKRSKKR